MEKDIKVVKEALKKVIRSLRTKENQVWANALLGIIDTMEEEKITSVLSDIRTHCNENGLDFKEEIKNVLQSKILEMQNEGKGQNYSLNAAFLFNIHKKSALLHMPIKFTKPFGNTEQFLCAMDSFNPYLLDAISTLKDLKDKGFHVLDGVDNIEMHSPILRGPELEFLSNLGFKTNYYLKGKYKDPKYLEENPDAIIGITKFNGKSFGSAKISFKEVDSKEFQEKLKKKQKEFQDRGFILKEDGPMQ